MKIPIFVSCPSTLNRKQELWRKLIIGLLEQMNLEPRAIGRSDYPTEAPLHEVLVLARKCSGGIILGFEQYYFPSGVLKRGTKDSIKLRRIPIPSPWNHIESGVLFSLGVPLLVFKEEGVSGGIFDHGVTDVFIHEFPRTPILKASTNMLKDIMLKWQAQVREHYYQV